MPEEDSMSSVYLVNTGLDRSDLQSRGVDVQLPDNTRLDKIL